jgi:hypothetical protein
MKDTALWPHQNELIERGMRHSESFGGAKVIEIQKTMQVFEEQFLDILPKLRSDFFDGFLAGYLCDYSRISPFESEAYRYGYSRGYELTQMEDNRSDRGEA